MVPQWLSSLQPFVELTAGFWLLWRVDSRKYPALMVYLVTEACWHIIASWGPQYTWLLRCGHIERMVVRAWVVGEVFQYARLGLDRRVWTVAATTACSLSAIAAVWMPRPLPTFYSLMIFREYYQIGLAVALWALCARFWPILEKPSIEVLAHRYGITVWMSVLAVSGTFVNGGLAWRFFRDTDFAYDLCSLVTYASLTLTVGVLAVGMGWQGRERLAQSVKLDRRRYRKMQVLGKAA